MVTNPLCRVINSISFEGPTHLKGNAHVQCKFTRFGVAGYVVRFPVMGCRRARSGRPG